LVVLAAGVSVSAAWADTPQITVPSSGIDWSAGTVTVSADYPAGTQSVVFSAIGQTIATVVVADDTVAGTVSSGVPFPLTTPTDFSADARDAQNASIGVAMLELTPAMYRPSAPELELAAGTVVDFSLALKAVSDHTVTSVVVKTEPEPLTHPVTLVTGADGQIAVSGVRVPYGVEQIELIARNGFGSSLPSKAETVYSLGPRSKLPERSRYVLVDKRSMTLYYVRGQRVVRHYDIAIGTPSTPTPNGYFVIGAARPASGPWGVLRRPLYRVFGSRRKPSGFYIHGTDEPWSIGTWASHGCVRLYNWEIRNFSKTVPNGTLVLIRP
jgi:hypothetical protein